MAKKYDWGDGNGAIHTVTLSQHQADLAVQAAQAHRTPATTQAATALLNTAPVTPAPGAPARGAPSAPAPGQPAPAAGTPATTPAAASITPDATFIANAAKQAFANTTQINSLTSQGENDKTDTQTAINRLIENALKDRQGITEGAGKEGLFYSGQLTRRLGDYETQLNRATGDASRGLKERQDARDAAIRAINEGAPLDTAVELAAAGDRQTGRDTAAADLGALVPDVNLGGSTQVAAIQQLVNPPKVVSSGAQATKPYTEKAGTGGVWHTYPGGRKVWVPKRR